MGLLDNLEPATRCDTSDYGIDAPIMDGPYTDVAGHAMPAADVPVWEACNSVARQLRAIADRDAGREATLAGIRARLLADANVPTRGGPYRARLTAGLNRNPD